VKPSAATLSGAQARLIAEAARRHGNGHIDLTARANLQIRGLDPRSAEALAEQIVVSGLASADPSLEAIRNVMASPLGSDDPSAAFDSHALAREVEAMLARETALWGLPSKFGIVVDGGGVLPLAGVGADIKVCAHDGALAVHLDGGSLAAPCSLTTVASTLKILALAFLRLAAQRSEHVRRMRTLVTAIGEEAVFGAAGLGPTLWPADSKSQARNPIGLISWDNRARSAFGVGLPFGRMEAEALTHLAGLAERFGDATLRTTPWRTLLLPGIAASETARLATEIESLGLIADPADPRLTIFACVGAPSCQNASVDARGDASRLAAVVRAAPGQTLHVSGCSKSCARRGAAALTLVGRGGRYDLVRNGAAADRPSLTGLAIEQVMALLHAVKRPCP
jgi:precorrin-3B synthase